MKKTFSVLISSFILVIGLTNKALAQDNFGLNRLIDVNLGNQPLQDSIAGIINIFLGFLGILATLLLLYAGFLWMTSRGNAEKIARAKLLISSALIGLVIILSSYAISQFILKSLVNETIDNVPSVACVDNSQCLISPNLCCLSSGFCGSCATLPVDNCYEPGTTTNGFTVPGGASDPRICSLGDTSGQAGSGFWIKGWHFDVNPTDDDPGISGKVTIGGVDAEIIECAGSNLWYNKKVKVKVPDTLSPGVYSVILTNDDSITNQNIFPLEIFNFEVIPGTSSVNIDCIVPAEHDVTGLPASVQILGNGFDVAGSATINTWTAGVELRDTLATSAWSDLQIGATIPNNALDSYVEVTVGASSDTEPFDITCTDDLQCASQCCSDNSCLPASVCDTVNIIPDPNTPVINSVSPEDGAVDTLLTIYGNNFCANTEPCIPGTVTMNGTLATPPAICGDIWTDDYIVVEVPSGNNGDVLDIVVTQDIVHGGLSSDPYPGFTVDTSITRPGLCSLGPDNGVFGDNINIIGVNFSAANDDDAYFDTVLSYQTDFINANSINTQVPNVVGAVGVRIKNTSDIYSNALPFTALAGLDGLPVITEITPDNGPTDAYITIRGNNFGDTQGTVRFDILNSSVPGLFDFPAVCGSTWSDNEIIVKVPAGIAGVVLADVVRANDNVDSNDYEFTVNGNLLGPQICAIFPNNGPVGNLVTISGENFGPSIGGQVLFHENTQAPIIANWFSNQISGIEIPVGAQTGPLELIDASGNSSNPMLFTIGSCDNDSQCGGATPFCCPGVVGNSCVVNDCNFTLNQASYSWEINTAAEPFGLYYAYSCTSDLQSPSPWPDQHEDINLVPQDSLDAFPNTNIIALFTRDVEDTDLVINKVEVLPCGQTANFDANNCGVAISEDDNILDIINPGSDREGFEFTPLNDLDPGTWYQVNLLGIFNAQIGDDTWTQDPIDDQWIFKTRDSADACVVNSVVVSPQNSHANIYPGGEKDFNASPLAINCNVCGGDYNWDWTVDHNPGPVSNYASILPLNNPLTNQGYTRMTGGLQSTENLAPPSDIVTLTASTTSDGVNILGQSDVVILSPVLRIDSYAPNCDDSCGNAEVSVDFNTDLQLASPNQFAVQECIAGNCNNLGPNLTNSIDNTNLQLVVVDGLNQALASGQTYKVTVDQTVVNIYGYELGEDFSWQFTVGDANCQMTGASIYPLNRTVYNLDNILYRGSAIAEGGSCGAQAITCLGCDYNWSSDTTSIATIDSGGIDKNNVYATPQNDGVTNINLTIDGTAAGYGSELFSTPLTVNTSSVGSFIVTDYFPNCGACSNSEAQVWFNSNVDPNTVDFNSVKIFDITDINNIIYNNPVSSHIVINDHIIIDHGPFILGNSYRIEVAATVRNLAGDSLSAPWVSPDILIENGSCLANGAFVDPVAVTLGANDTQDYEAVTTYGSATCAPAPVSCPTCSYNWTLPSPGLGDLGTFDSTNIKTPIFTTLASVVTGNNALVEPLVSEGVNPLPVIGGTLDIIEDGPLASSIPLFEHSPIGIDVCNNIAPYVKFDVSDGSLDRNIAGQHFKLYDQAYNVVPGSVRFVDSVSGELTVFYDTNQILSNLRTYWVGFDNFNAIVGEDVNDIVNNQDVGLAVNPAIGANSLVWSFITGDNSCPIHNVEIEPQVDLFMCITNSCEGDTQGVGGNQHNYEAVVYDIQNQILSSASIVYNWLSGDNLIVDLQNTIDLAVIYGTAGDNGNTYLALDAYLNTPEELNNIVSDNASVIVNTCQAPWPSLTTYPWNESASPDMNFSTYYCQQHSPEEVALPQIDIPHEVNSPDPLVLREYIDTIYYQTADSGETNSYLGSLAYYDEFEKEINESWSKKLSSLFKPEQVNSASLGCTPLRVQNLDYIYNGVDAIELSWYNPPKLSGPASTENPEYFIIDRLKTNDPAGWQTLDGHFPIHIPPAHPEGNYTYTDNTIDINTDYSYRVRAVNTICLPASDAWWHPLEQNPIISANTYAGNSIVDILGFRVMDNSDHLSVSDWYNKNAPNSEQSGRLIKVDGYEALQVGGTTYVAASNIVSGNLYTNIYIIAHNVGARSTTIDIYQQMVDNFKLNINIASATTENTCTNQNNLSCSSDFDCPSYCDDNSGDNQVDCTANWDTDTCNSRLAKLRRDTKRLGDLVNIENSLEFYGENHKACSNNSLISCETANDCPSTQPCISYYPPLNAGSYLSGLSNSSWPSWRDAFSNVLGTGLPVDPVSRFNGCGNLGLEDYDFNTCWDETALKFVCPEGSLVYMYAIEDSGQNYSLAANFEYDIDPYAGVTFLNNLTPMNIGFDVTNNSCDANVIGAPGSYTNPSCGNGISGEDYCTVSCTDCDTNGALCVAAGGVIRTEECDGGFQDFVCKDTLGDFGWWNEQSVGCYSPGTIVNNALVECTWYNPNPALTAEQCGGYCGDNTLQPYYESCDGGLPSPNNYICAAATDTLDCGSGCQVTCDNGTDIYPAALCGDGIWSEGIEECDASSNPNGLSGWDCTEGGGIQCNNSCEITCTVGEPYPGSCGNGVINGTCDVPCPTCDPSQDYAQNNVECMNYGGNWTSIEVCDYLNYISPLPQYTGLDPLPSYGCTLACEMDGTYCGDGILNANYQELCDYGVGPDQYETPSPILSHQYNQYKCRDSGSYQDTDGNFFEACTATLGGYCGDGKIQDGVLFPDYGEKCDPGSPWDNILPNPPVKNPSNTDIDNQYACDVDCEDYTGGYCGDGITQDGNQDGNYNALIDYGEECDYFNFISPSPAASGLYYQATGLALQYSCHDSGPDICTGFGGYCGDGITNGNEVCDDGSDNGDYGFCKIDCSGIGEHCGDGITNGNEVCDGNIACSDYDGTYLSGRVSCSPDCQNIDIGGCCTQNKLSIKFLADNEFNFYINNYQESDWNGNDWTECGGSGLDANGACEWFIDGNTVPYFDFNDFSGNVLAFEAMDTGAAGGNVAGVVGTFSCQQTTCQSICYKGPQAGKACNSDGSCDGIGVCIYPGDDASGASLEGVDCNFNNDCKGVAGYTTTNFPTGDWQNKPSLCIPAGGAQAIDTAPGGLWNCTDDQPSTDPASAAGNWKTTDYEPALDLNVSWQSAGDPESVLSPWPNWADGWWDSRSESYWEHMIPGATAIWHNPIYNDGTQTRIYCRYFMAKD